jgi:hypothetical protein
MWGLDSLGLPISADGTVTLPFWAAVTVAVVLLVLFVLALIRTGVAGTLVFIALVGFGIWAAFEWTDHEAVAQRRALEQQALALGAQALAPGSGLACLRTTGVDAVDTACERVVFANPERAAAALSLVAHRLTLLDQQTSFTGKRDAGFDNAFTSLRNSLEQDRFGIVAQVLATRYGCTPERCDMLRVLHDPAKVKKNLSDRTFETTVARHAAAWATAEASPSGSAPATTAGIIPGTVAAPIPDRYTLPSSASIPPVSIMSAEPAPRPAAPPPASRRTNHRQQSTSPQAAGPVQLHPQQPQ